MQGSVHDLCYGNRIQGRTITAVGAMGTRRQAHEHGETAQPHQSRNSFTQQCTTHSLVPKDGSQPFLRLLHRNTFPLGIVGDLVPVNLAHSEILGLRVSKIEPTDTGCRKHRQGLCQFNADFFLCLHILKRAM